MTERWAPIPKHPGYEASDMGRVRSVDRVAHGRRLKGRVLKLNQTGENGAHRGVYLGRGVKRLVHHLVLEAFVGPCPPGMEACHWNDIGDDNHLSNLRWDTPSANGFDQVRNGKNFHAAKTHCKWGHEFTPENTWNNGRWRQCRTCLRRRARETKLRKLAA